MLIMLMLVVLVSGIKGHGSKNIQEIFCFSYKQCDLNFFSFFFFKPKEKVTI